MIGTESPDRSLRAGDILLGRRRQATVTRALYALAAAIVLAAVIVAVAFRYDLSGEHLLDRWTGCIRNTGELGGQRVPYFCP